jgi:nitroreductase
MEVKEALLARRSIRSFTDEPVSEEDIVELLHAGMSGPSAINKRPWEFYVVKDPEKQSELRRVGFANYLSPLMIVVAGNARHFIPFLTEFWVQDTSAATENILLEATELGLGAVWCGLYPDRARAKKVRKILEMPLGVTPLNIIVIGHPKGKPPLPRDQFDPKKVHSV